MLVKYKIQINYTLVIVNKIIISLIIQNKLFKIIQIYNNIYMTILKRYKNKICIKYNHQGRRCFFQVPRKKYWIFIQIKKNIFKIQAISKYKKIYINITIFLLNNLHNNHNNQNYKNQKFHKDLVIIKKYYKELYSFIIKIKIIIIIKFLLIINSNKI